MEERDTTSTESLSPESMSPEELEEQRRIDKALEKEGRRSAPISTGCLLRASIAAIALTIVCSGLGTLAYRSWLATLTAKRDAIIAEIRAQGDPMTPEEMAAFSGTPQEMNELTKRFLKMLEDRKQNGGFAPGDEVIPIVGGGNVVPRPGEPWELQATVEDFLSKRPWIDEAEAIAEIDGEIRVPRDYGSDGSRFLEQVRLTREMQRELRLRLLVRLRTGDRAGALRSLRASFRLARVCEGEPEVLSQLIRTALHNMNMTVVCEFLRDGKATPEEIAAIRELLHDDFHASLVRTLKGERASGFITLTTYDASQLNAYLGSGTGIPTIPSKAKLCDLRPGDTAKLLETVGDLIAVAEKDDFPTLIRQIKMMEGQRKQMAQAEAYSLPWDRHVLVVQSLPRYFQCAEALARALAMQSALKAALEVEEKFLILGSDGRTRDAEIAAIEEVLPTDPFTGQPMKYVVGDLMYHIYSVGPNGIDDTASGKNLHLDFGVQIERRLAKPNKDHESK